MNLFKKFKKNNKEESKEAQLDKVNQAIQSLRQHITLLEKKKSHLDKKINAYNQAIKKCLKEKNRNAALAKIKLRKQNEKRVQTLDNQIFNLEIQIMALDETLTNKNIMETMKLTKAALTVSPEMIDEAEQLQEDLAEQMELNQEFNDLLSTPLNGIDYDDDALLEELAELEMLDNDKFLYGEDTNIQKNKNKKLVMLEISDQDDDDEDVDEDEDDDDDEQFEKEMKKLDVEMNMSANCSREVIDVQLVSSSNKMLIQSC